MAYEDLFKLVQSRNFVVRVRVETGGRKGKTVTILDGLPKTELFLKELLKHLKTSLGAGGTYIMDKRDGMLELQGDHRTRVCVFLDKLQIKHR
jgi:translation initiation factor 1